MLAAPVNTDTAACIPLQHHLRPIFRNNVESYTHFIASCGTNQAVQAGMLFLLKRLLAYQRPGIDRNLWQGEPQTAVILKQLLSTTMVLCALIHGVAQRVPNESERIDYLVTFGQEAPPSTGDDDHIQIIFFVIPQSYKHPVYLRIFDPDTGSNHDEVTGTANTATRFSVYGGVGSFSSKEAREVRVTSNFKTGNLLASKVFTDEAQFDSEWFNMGPFNPLEGELVPSFNGYVLKVVVEGLKGNDGNHYRFFLSEDPGRNKGIEGANAFAYKYTFKLHKAQTLAHIYPFIENSVVSITQHNFDFDHDGEILLYSVSKNRVKGEGSGDNVWASSNHLITEKEKNLTMDIQIQKTSFEENTMTVYITNQYNEAVPFFALPIGGPPKYKYNLKVTTR